MERVLSYDVAGFIITGIVLISFYRNKAIPLYHNKIFSYLLWANLASCFFNVFYWIVNYTDGSVALRYVGNTGYFIFHPLSAILSLVYVIGMIREWSEMSLKIKLSIIVPTSILFVSVLLNPLTKMIFYYDETNTYKRGSYVWIIYVITIYAFAYMIIYLFRYKKHFSTDKRIALISLVVFVLLSTIIQFFMPLVLVENCAVALSMLMLLLTLQNPATIIDAKTGLYNRKIFTSVMSVNYSAYKRGGLINVVIKEFHILDKTLGLKQSRLIISEVQKYLSAIDKNAKVFCISDGSFCVELKNIPDEEVEKFAEEVSIRFKAPWKSENYSTLLNAKVFCVIFPRDAENVDKLMKMLNWFESEYDDKTLLYADTVNESIMSRVSDIKIAIAEKIKNNGFEIMYLPTFSFASKKIISAEASVRFYDEKLGYVYPEEFIPIAEKNGYMLCVGKVIFENVCRFLCEQKLKERGVERIEVSLSIIQCMQFGIAEEFLGIMDKYGISPSQICFQIAEGAASGSTAILRQYMMSLHEKGVCFCLDNYGIGYSNISYIYDLPFNMVKISKSVMTAASNNKKAAITLESTLKLVKELGMNTVVEGVENEHFFKKLFGMQCDYAQGYYFSSPLSENELIGFIEQFTPPDIPERSGVNAI